MSGSSTSTFTAPTADAVTFYLSNADTSGTASATATFDDTDIVQPKVTYPNINTVFSQSASNARSWFKFYLDINSEANGSNNIVGLPTSSVTVAIPALQDETNTTTVLNVANLQEDYLKQTAREMFGTSEAVGLIINSDAVVTGYNAAQTTAASTLNTNLSSGAKVITNSAEITKLIFDKNPTRFTLAFQANIITTGSYIVWPEGTYLGANDDTTVGDTEVFTVVTSTGSGTGAKITVKINSSNAIEAMFITPSTNLYEPNSGSGYAEGDDLLVTYTSGGNSHQIKIDAINSVQVAMLNGTYDNSFIYGLTAGASIVASDSGDGSFDAGTTSNLSVSGGSGAVVEVKMTSTTEIYSIELTTASTTADQYLTGDVVTITNGTHQISITLTASQATLLNVDSLTSTSVLTGTSPPLMTGDNIRIKYIIASAAGQTNVQGTAISYSQISLVDFNLS